MENNRKEAKAKLVRLRADNLLEEDRKALASLRHKKYRISVDLFREEQVLRLAKKRDLTEDERYAISKPMADAVDLTPAEAAIHSRGEDRMLTEDEAIALATRRAEEDAGSTSVRKRLKF